jgi:hypothetical protein
MPTSAGPNSKGEENLVFSYDLGDVSNSYKGQPTTNFIAELGDPTQEIARGEFGQYYNLVDIFETHGLVPYTLSMEIKGNIPGSCLVYMQNGSYTKYAFSLGSVDITTEWQRFSFRNRTPSGPTLAWQQNTPNDNRAMLATYTGYGSGRNPTVKNVQLEFGPHETPFTAGTRLTTQGLLDLTGNSTIDLTNVSFDSNAQMTFDGTDDYLTLPDIDTYSSTAKFTIEGVVRAIGGNWGRIFTNGSNGVLGSVTGFINTDLIISTSSSRPYIQFRVGNSGYILSTQISTNYWSSDDFVMYFAFSANKESKTGTYLFRFGQNNGLIQEELSGTYTPGNSTSFVENRLGAETDNETYAQMDMYMFKMYDRDLSLDEMRKNYKTIKSRFNI